MVMVNYSEHLFCEPRSVSPSEKEMGSRSQRKEGAGNIAVVSEWRCAERRDLSGSRH